MTDDTVVGKLGTVVLPIRKGRPGEISVRIRGGSEVYMAYSEEEFTNGQEVIVIGQNSARTVTVSSF